MRADDPNAGDWLDGARPPGELPGDGVVLRDTRDVPTDAIVEVIRDSRAGYLDQWMPWASDDANEPGWRAYLRAGGDEPADAGDERSREFAYAILDADGEVVGVCSLIDRLRPGALEIGYWVRRDRQGEGFATRAAALLADAALALAPVTSVEIHHDAANTASRAVPLRLGFRKAREEAREPTAPGESGTTWVWEWSG